MTFEQARILFGYINQGQPVGVDASGDVVTANTSLGIAMSAIGVRTYIPRTGRVYGAPGKYHQTEEAVAFLREWADALDSEPVTT